MNIRNLVRVIGLAIAVAVIAGCNAPPQKTEVLAADGADVGKAFTELQTALASGDNAHANKMLDPQWRIDGDTRSYSTLLRGLKPTGGKRQGDHATLFVLGDNFAAFNATLGANGWYFDRPTPIFFPPDKKSDCMASPQRFPCGATSAPDSQVSGSASEMDQEHKILKTPLFDGFAAREISFGAKTPLWTRLILSGTDVNPQVLAESESPSGLASELTTYVLVLDIAPDGKSAKGKYTGHMETRRFDIKDGSGLSLDTSQPNRLRGRLTANVSDTVKLDVTFDVGIASEYAESNMAL